MWRTVWRSPLNPLRRNGPMKVWRVRMSPLNHDDDRNDRAATRSLVQSKEALATFKNIELLAAKVYGATGVVIITIFFGNTFYVVLSDATGASRRCSPLGARRLLPLVMGRRPLLPRGITPSLHLASRRRSPQRDGGSSWGRRPLLTRWVRRPASYACVTHAISLTPGEQPLLDSRFPDVSSKGRGYQINAYPDGSPTWKDLRKVSIWQTASAMQLEMEQVRERACERVSGIRHSSERR